MSDTYEIPAESSLPFTTLRDPRYVNPQKTLIGCTVVLRDKPQLGEVLFIADPHDAQAYCRTLFNQCLKGKYGPVAEFVPPPAKK